MLDRTDRWQRSFASITYEDFAKLARRADSRIQIFDQDIMVYKKGLATGWIEEFFPSYRYPGPDGTMIRRIFRKNKPRTKVPEIVALFDKINEKKIELGYLAYKAGISVAALRNWRDGENLPMLKEYSYVVQALGCKITIEEV